MSSTGAPQSVGGPSGSPVTAMTPPIACTSMSTPGFSRHGPSGPNADGGSTSRDQRSQARPVDAEPLGHAARMREGFEHHVGARHQPLEGRATLGSGQIDGGAALVAIDGDEDCALATDVRAVGGPRRVAAGGLLDLHDVGPHVGQVHPHGSGDEVGELEHAVAGQGQGHGPAPQSARVRPPSPAGVIRSRVGGAREHRGRRSPATRRAAAGP